MCCMEAWSTAGAALKTENHHWRCRGGEWDWDMGTEQQTWSQKTWVHSQLCCLLAVCFRALSLNFFTFKRRPRHFLATSHSKDWTESAASARFSLAELLWDKACEDWPVRKLDHRSGFIITHYLLIPEVIYEVSIISALQQRFMKNRIKR